MQELVEIALDIVAKWPSSAEAALAIKRKRRLECWTAAGFEAQTLQAPSATLFDNMVEQSGRHATTQKVGMGPH